MTSQGNGGSGAPDDVTLIRHESGIEIVRRWFGLHYLLIGGVGLVFGYQSALILAAAGPLELLRRTAEDGSPMGVFLLLFFAAGIGMTYCGVAGLVNRTSIRVGREKISVRRGPVPWFGDGDLAIADVWRLHSRSRTYGSSRQHSSHSVHVITLAGRNLRLVGGLETSAQAVFIENQIEKFLPPRASRDAARTLTKSTSGPP